MSFIAHFFFFTVFLLVTLFISNQLVAFVHTVSDEVTISITDDGFVPSHVTIHNGTTVVWENDGKKPHWPASANHPTHTVYPEHSQSDCLGSSFDACRGLEPGESFSFTFDK